MTKRIKKDDNVNAVMYIFINKGLSMSAGKMSAQAAHAAIEAYKQSSKHFIEQWELGGHYTKLVMEAWNTEHLMVIGEYLSSRGFAPVAIIDEGMTEVEAHSLTALGIPIVNKFDAHTAATFSTFELYHEKSTKKRWFR